MSPRIRRLLYVLFTLFCLAAGMILTFPYDVLGRRIEAEAAKAMPGSTLVIGETGPALPLGVRLGDLMLERPGKDGVAGPKFVVESVVVRPSLLSLLGGKPGVTFVVD